VYFNRTGLILLFFCLIIFLAPASAQRYNVDGGGHKSGFHLNIKHIFQKNPERKAARQENKKINRSARFEKKAIKKYWKIYDHPKEIKSDQRVYKRMKKNLNRSDRINQGKHPDSWLKRMFQPKRKTKRVKQPKGK
jgi:hypothetical protein